MKTSISLTDDLFERGEAFSKQLSLSRSELYVRAIREYLIYQIYVQETIDQGLEASADGRVHNSEYVLQKLDLSHPPQIP